MPITSGNVPYAGGGEAFPAPTIAPANHDWRIGPGDSSTMGSGDLQALGHSVYKRFESQIGYALTGEREALLGYAVTAIAGGNMVVFGPPGGGKSVLLRDAQRVFTDMDGESVRTIPPQSDLTGKELAGGVVETVKITISPQGETHETTRTAIEPILHPNTRIIVGDEVNRANPLAIGAVLEALESGILTTNQGVHTLDRLQFAVFGLNPRGTDKTVFPMSSALISRMARGASMGTNPGEINEIINRAADGTLSRPEQMKGVISFEELRALRTANEKLFTSEALMPEFRAIVKTILADLAEMRIHESPGRIAKQVRRTAGALALLGGHSASYGITTADLLQAGKFLMVARVGASEVPNDPHLAYKDVLDKLKVSDEDRKNSWFVSQLHPTKLQN